MMPIFNIDFEVYCSCGHRLSNQSNTKRNVEGLSIIVTYCEKCSERIMTEGYYEGYEQGYADEILEREGTNDT